MTRRDAESRGSVPSGREQDAAADWDALQDRLAARAVAYGAEHSTEIGHRLAGAGMSPGDVAGVADLQAIPVLAKDDLPALQAADPPFGGMLAVAAGSLARIYRSPGPISDPQGTGDDFWRFAAALRTAGFRSGDVVLNSFSYHLTPGGLMLDGGLRAAGCTVIPGGVAATTAQIEAARAAGATGYTGTPQFLLTLLERAEESGEPLGFERALVTGAPLPPSLRARLQDGFGVDVYQAYGTADTGLLGYECAEKDGWHVAPEVVIEVLVPADDRSAGEGEAGQVVVTSPNEVYPLVRFGTGDLSAWKRAPCPCGRPGPRLAGFLGRVGEGVKVKGMFVHPRELAAALGSDPAVARYQAVVTADGARDVFTVRVEAAPGAVVDKTALIARIREAVKIRPVVEVVGARAIPDDARALVDTREELAAGSG
ncbi:MAG: AMP-binding protein [Gammaproteobacteria bacterium]|nr:AMP-binding protein [Gammaproteobacteria bacterium]MDE0259803.1 AMP-binding protein [Gammaproteobacteria bacterium]